ncbi:MAG: tetratricopeptide repeat protein [Deltaproteobacteria bacterium]|nr:tetratricopeptide repeat protein [Deltaproteobacteria bacterium]
MSKLGELLKLNKTMKMVLLVVAVLSAVMVIMLWRYYQLRSVGQDARYKAPMHHYSAGEKKMIRGKFKKALKEYETAREMLEKIPGINLDQDFYYGIVLNSIGTIYLRIGIYGQGRDTVKRKEDLGKYPDKIRRAQSYFERSIKIYRTWLAAHRPPEEEVRKIKASRVGMDPDKIELRPFERYERALSVALCNLGMARRYLGDTQAALKIYREALEIWPENRPAQNNLETLEVDLGLRPPPPEPEKDDERGEKLLDRQYRFC